MAWETVLGSRPALRVLVVGDDAGTRHALDVLDGTGRRECPDDEVRPAAVPDLAGALTALAGSRFDCILLTARPGASADAGTVRSLREGAGTAAVVVVCDTGSPAADLLEDCADLVLGPDELVGGGVRALRQASEHARLVWRLRLADGPAATVATSVSTFGDDGAPVAAAVPAAAAPATASASASASAMFTIDVDGRVISWTDGAAALYGYPAAEVVGRDVTVLHPDSASTAAATPVAAGTGPAACSSTTAMARTRDGRLLPVRLDVAPQVDAHGRPLGAVVLAGPDPTPARFDTGSDDTLHATLHDGLTGLPNAAHLRYRLTQELGTARRSGVPVAVLAVDLDRFRAVDDLHGRITGDRVLAEVAQRLCALVRPTDLVARTGGDGFAIVRPATDEAAAARLAQRVVEAVGTPIRLAHRAVRVDASVGVAVSPPLAGGAGAILKLAELALYEAKARGRAQVLVFDTSLSERSRELLRLSEDLRAALAEDRLDVRYQPMVHVATGRLAGYEALTRWHDPGRGEVSPGLFVRVAEQGGFAAELDRWVLARACRDLRGALDRGALTAEARLSVNLSTRSLGDPALVAWLDGLLGSTGIPAEALVLEVTETAIAHDVMAASLVLDGLRGLGVGIALDDFGTGYSSLSFLRDLPVTQVKVDRSFVANLGAAHPGDLFITESVVDLARRLGLQTVAEGVETCAQLAVLRRIGCDLAQGHLWSGAVPATRLGVLDGTHGDHHGHQDGDGDDRHRRLPRPLPLRRRASAHDARDPRNSTGNTPDMPDTAVETAG